MGVTVGARTWSGIGRTAWPEGVPLQARYALAGAPMQRGAGRKRGGATQHAKAGYMHEFFFNPPADGAKKKLKLTMLPRVFIHVILVKCYNTRGIALLRCIPFSAVEIAGHDLARPRQHRTLSRILRGPTVARVSWYHRVR